MPCWTRVSDTAPGATEMETVVRAPTRPDDAFADGALPVRQFGQWGLVWRRFTHHRVAVAGACLVLLMVAMTLFGSFIAPPLVPIDVYGQQPAWALHQVDLAPQLWPPHWRFLLGTDAHSDPVLTYVLIGGEPLLLIGVLGALIASVLGGIIGSLAGYLGGIVDVVLMRLVDAFLAVPFLLLLILFSQSLSQAGADRSPLLYSVLFGMLGWAGIARLVRGYILSLREREFAEAARALGASPWGIILRHLLPNALDVLVVSFTLNIAVFIVTEVTLDFLNAGTSAITWGTDLQRAFSELMEQNNWWVGVFPALPILFTALGFNFLGDGLRDALDATSSTALALDKRGVRVGRAGPIRRGARAGVQALSAARQTARASLGQARRQAGHAAGAVPLPARLRALGRAGAVPTYRTAPLWFRIGPIPLVTIAIGLVVLYSHSGLVYSPHYSSPTAYGPTFAQAQYGAVLKPSGGWDLLAIDARRRIAFERIDAQGRVTQAHELAPGDDSSRPSLAERGRVALATWIGNGGQTVYAEALGASLSHPFALNPPGGTVWNPDVVATPRGFSVLFAWQRPGASDTDLYLAPLGSGNRRPVRLVRSGDYVINPRAVVDGSGHLDVIYLQRFAGISIGLWHVLFQRFTPRGKPLSTPHSLGTVIYLAATSTGCNGDNVVPPQWAIDLKRARNGSVWAAWETGSDCVSRDIGGLNTLSVGHWTRNGRVLLPPAPVDPSVDANAQAVALALHGHGGLLYYPQPGLVEPYLVASGFSGQGLPLDQERVNYDAGGSIANPQAGRVGKRPVIIWEKVRLRSTSTLVGTAYHHFAPPDLLTRLGLNLGALWGNIALVLFGSLGAGLALTLVNVYLLVPLIVVWLLIRRLPPRFRWPLFLAALALLLAWIFALGPTVPDYVLVMTTLGVPSAWLAVAGGVVVAGWAGRYFLFRQESALRATAMALIALYFVAIMYAVIYIEGQIGRI